MFEMKIKNRINEEYRFENRMESFLGVLKKISDCSSVTVENTYILKTDLERFKTVLNLAIKEHGFIIRETQYDHSTHPYISSLSFSFIKEEMEFGESKRIKNFSYSIYKAFLWCYLVPQGPGIWKVNAEGIDYKVVVKYLKGFFKGSGMPKVSFKIDRELKYSPRKKTLVKGEEFLTIFPQTFTYR